MKKVWKATSALAVISVAAMTISLGTNTVKSESNLDKVVAELDAYKAKPGVSGKITSVGSDTLANLMTFWSEGFQKHYPGVTFEVSAEGSSTAPPALIEGRSDIGPMSRKMKDKEEEAFESKYGYKPSVIRVALDALAVYVNKDNPVSQLKLEQVDAIFSSTRKLKYPTDITTWGQAGVSQAGWADKDITMYGRNSASGTYGYFKKVALGKGDYKASVKQQPGSAGVIQQITADRYGIGYSGMGYLTAGVRIVPIAPKGSKIAWAATPENCYNNRYPLARYLYVYYNKPPNGELKSNVKEFLAYVLSKGGQEIVIKDGFIPLKKELVEEELSKIGVSSGGGMSTQDIVNEIDSYRAVSGISGKISSVGSDTLANLMTLWSEDFQKHYPGVTFEVSAEGSSTAPPALIEGRSDIGPMSRAMKDKELEAFEAKYGYKPTAIKVSLDALAVYVNKDNPVKSLSLPQVDAIFSSTRKKKYPTDITKWGQAGVAQADWAGKDITMYGRNSASGTYGYFKKVAMGKGDYKASVKQQPGSAGVIQQITADRYGIGYSGMGYLTAGVKFVDLAKDHGGKAYAATPDNCYTGDYPLARYLYIYFNKAPGQDLRPVTKEFLKFVLSRGGQQIVLKDGFIPMKKNLCLKERAILE